MKKILIVDDEKSMRTGLRDNLEFEGFETDEAENGKTGLEKILNNQYDLIILDVMMPLISGYEVCKNIRAKGIATPVILLTARGEELDKIMGLELGADDYITKPFSIRELIARINAVLRRSPSVSKPEDKNILIGRLQINFANFSAFIDGHPAEVSVKEFEILQLLWKEKNNNVSRQKILETVWGEDVMVTSRTIDNFIVKLRQKIEPDPNTPKFIITIHGLGYKLICS